MASTAEDRGDARSRSGRTAPTASCCPASAPSPIAAAGSMRVDGMVEALTEAVRDKARPFFGICVGMQLMATRGKEHVTTDGLRLDRGRRRSKIAPPDRRT